MEKWIQKRIKSNSQIVTEKELEIRAFWVAHFCRPTLLIIWKMASQKNGRKHSAQI